MRRYPSLTSALQHMCNGRQSCPLHAPMLRSHEVPLTCLQKDAPSTIICFKTSALMRCQVWLQRRHQAYRIDPDSFMSLHANDPTMAVRNRTSQLRMSHIHTPAPILDSTNANPATCLHERAGWTTWSARLTAMLEVDREGYSSAATHATKPCSSAACSSFCGSSNSIPTHTPGSLF